jgi:outer membrane lipoprotein-sorting protein
MKKIKYFSFLALFFCTFTFAGNNAENLLKKVQDKYKSINSFSADFIQYAGKSKKNSGTFLYKKENNIKLESNNSTIVSNGSTNWNYNKKQNKVIISDYSDSDASMFSFNKVLYDYPSKSKIEESNESGNSVLIITPKEGSDLNFSQAKLWINSNNLIKKVQIKENNSSLVTIELSNYRLDQNLADSQFTFTPPEGSKVIDLRQ